MNFEGTTEAEFSVVATIADGIVGKQLCIGDARMTGMYGLVEASLVAEGQEAAARFSFDDDFVARSYRVAHDDASFRITCQMAKPPAPVGWIEWFGYGQQLGLWWRCLQNDTLDVGCFLRTADGETSMVLAITAFRFGSAKFKLLYSDAMIGSESDAIEFASEYLRFFAVASASLNSQGKG